MEYTLNKLVEELLLLQQKGYGESLMVLSSDPEGNYHSPLWSIIEDYFYCDGRDGEMHHKEDFDGDPDYYDEETLDDIKENCPAAIRLA
jgi:hypothetical protein